MIICYTQNRESMEFGKQFFFGRHLSKAVKAFHINAIFIKLLEKKTYYCCCSSSRKKTFCIQSEKYAFIQIKLRQIDRPSG